MKLLGAGRADNGFQQLRRPSASGLEALANGLLPTAAFARAGGSGALAATGAACTLPLEEGALLLARPAAGAGGAAVTVASTTFLAT